MPEPINLEFTVSFVPAKIKKIIVRDNVTIVLWDDGTKTRATCDGNDQFDPVIGLGQNVLKKLYGKRKIASLMKRIEYQVKEKK
jgi:hypothetical protein